MIRRLDTRTASPEEVRLALTRPALDEVEVAPSVQASLDRIFGAGTTPEQAVERILSDVQAHGDAALVDYVERIDGVRLAPEELFVTEDEIAQARREADPAIVDAILKARDRIRTFHERQMLSSWFITEPNGTVLGQQITPIRRAGCYIPGGRFPLVSTALMCVVPAVVAGVEEIIAATPCNSEGKLDPHMIVALDAAGANRILRTGGAQTIAALAYGTTWVPAVDKIVGPGNLFVQLAKKMVFGRVGIDSLAGPSEILIIADETADPEWVAADLLSQAEHDTEAAAMLLTTDEALADAVEKALAKQLAALPRQEEAAESLRRWGLILTCANLDEALELADVVAPEHLELLVKEPMACLGKLRNAGSIFLGSYSTEPLADYVAGPNHVLPTNRSARFSSPLGVDQFLRRSGVMQVGSAGLEEIGGIAVTLARLEGLEAHARAVEQRLQGRKDK